MERSGNETSDRSQSIVICLESCSIVLVAVMVVVGVDIVAGLFDADRA